MRIRAKIALRNDVAVSAREKLGLSQVQLAEQAGVSARDVYQLEGLKFEGFKSSRGREKLAVLSAFLGVDEDELAPFELLGTNIVNSAFAVKDMPVQAMLGMVADLPRIESGLVAEEVSKAITRAMGCLTAKQREVIQLLYGVGDGAGQAHTIQDVCRTLNRSRGQVKLIEAKALQKMRHAKQSLAIMMAVDGEVEA